MPEQCWVPLLLLAGFPVTLALLGYLLEPLALRATERLVAHPAVAPLDLASVDPVVAAFLTKHADSFRRLGFDEPVFLRIGKSPRPIHYVAVAAHRGTGTEGLALAAEVPGQNRYNIQTQFATRYESGRAFATFGDTSFLPLPAPPRATHTMLPSVSEAEEVHALHQFVVGRHDASGQPVAFPPGGAAAYLRDVVDARACAHNAHRGLLVTADGGETYTFTLYGAYRGKWGAMWPLRPLRVALARRRERRLIREYQRGW